MTSSVQDSWERAFASVQGDDPLSRLARESLQSSAARFPGLGLGATAATQGLMFRIADSEAPGSPISANDAGDFLQRLQRAVARLAKARRARLADVARLLPLDLDLARLNVRATAMGSLIVDLVPQTASETADGSENLLPAGSSWAEIGAIELVRALPENPNDEASLDSLTSASPVVRRAVADLIHGLPNPKLNIDFTLRQRSGEKLTSCLTAPQANILRERLDSVREERQVVRMRGRLDGLRTRRQIFYFETPAGGEIHGYVDDSLMSAVKENLDAQVDVALESFVNRSGSGKASQRRYRLIEVAGQISQMPPESDFGAEDG
ncbi:hypothetical protein [Kitasatospora phosalacinea]|uniref:Uncharacterized protein n=1 Tax=Kitasatospora phosalacinea TaxID=2065 RepID=A0A9W6PQ98_9ACTN|nr:hypothetical protein [Kitasatospora phosalacinea]GLW59282.1 hypothetical protein Kpho01_72920 [Kitasatospora phosalacinea]